MGARCQKNSLTRSASLCGKLKVFKFVEHSGEKPAIAMASEYSE